MQVFGNFVLESLNDQNDHLMRENANGRKFYSLNVISKEGTLSYKNTGIVETLFLCGNFD